MTFSPLRDLFNLCFPATCAGCAQPLMGEENQLCLNCLVELPRTDHNLHVENPAQRSFMGRVNIARAAAFLHFQKWGRVQNLLKAIKYQDSPELAFYLGKICGREWRGDFFIGVDAILPVPLHQKKKKMRGYNQAAEFGKGVADAAKLELYENGLQRTTYTPSQTRRSRFNRWLNVQKVFEVANPEQVAHRHLLLVDDVLTTGATLEACAHELLAARAQKVSILTLAFADRY